MDDPYPPAAITAAAINFGVFGSSDAEVRLKSWCLNDNNFLALMAVNYLIYAREKAPFVETVRKSHDMKNRDYNVKAACMDFLGSLGLVPNNTDYRE